MNGFDTRAREARMKLRHGNCASTEATKSRSDLGLGFDDERQPEAGGYVGQWSFVL